MKLQVDGIDTGFRTALDEGDPLPPDDRVGHMDQPLLEALYRAQGLKLHRFFARRTDRQDAGDLVQESFARLASLDRAQTDELEKPEAFLTQIATNLLRNRARDAYNRTVARNDAAAERQADSTDMTAALEARDTLARLQSALGKLSPKTREIFLAHRLEGATYAEIAARWGLRVKSVEWHMSKALEHLHRAAGRR